MAVNLEEKDTGKIVHAYFVSTSFAFHGTFVINVDSLSQFRDT